jgi:hypothetical protein
MRILLRNPRTVVALTAVCACLLPIRTDAQHTRQPDAAGQRVLGIPVFVNNSTPSTTMMFLRADTTVPNGGTVAGSAVLPGTTIAPKSVSQYSYATWAQYPQSGISTAMYRLDPNFTYAVRSSYDVTQPAFGQTADCELFLKGSSVGKGSQTTYNCAVNGTAVTLGMGSYGLPMFVYNRTSNGLQFLSSNTDLPNGAVTGPGVAAGTVIPPQSSSQFATLSQTKSNGTATATYQLDPWFRYAVKTSYDATKPILDQTATCEFLKLQVDGSYKPVGQGGENYFYGCTVNGLAANATGDGFAAASERIELRNMSGVPIKVTSLFDEWGVGKIVGDTWQEGFVIQNASSGWFQLKWNGGQDRNGYFLRVKYSLPNGDLVRLGTYLDYSSPPPQ